MHSKVFDFDARSDEELREWLTLQKESAKQDEEQRKPDPVFSPPSFEQQQFNLRRRIYAKAIGFILH